MMDKMQVKPSIYSLKYSDLKEWLEQQGEKAFEQHKFLNGCIKNALPLSIK